MSITPKGYSFFVDNPSGERGYATGQRYRGLTTDFDKNTCYRVYYKRQKQWCISHYEHGSGKRTYHSLRKGIHYDLHCSYKIVKGRVIFSETPRLKKPAFKIYQKKKDFRFNDRISEKILEIKHNGAGFVQVGKGKRVLVYLFSY